MAGSTYVRVNTTTISNWKSNLSAINAECLSLIQDLGNISSELSIWKGNSGTRADEIANSLMSQATSFHEALKDVDDFLSQLVKSKSEQ